MQEKWWPITMYHFTVFNWIGGTCNYHRSFPGICIEVDNSVQDAGVIDALVATSTQKASFPWRCNSSNVEGRKFLYHCLCYFTDSRRIYSFQLRVIGWCEGKHYNAIVESSLLHLLAMLKKQKTVETWTFQVNFQGFE